MTRAGCQPLPGQTQADVRLTQAWEEIWRAAEDAGEEQLLEALNAIEVLWTLGAVHAVLPVLRELIAWLRSRAQED